MNAGDGTGSVTIAISKLFLGDTDPDGTPDHVNGWKNYGYDLDGQISTATSTNLCMPADGASATNVYPDGPGGIDNSFGKLILPILLGIGSDYSARVNAAIAGGMFTTMFQLNQLGSGAGYNPLTTNVFNGGNLGSPPRFDGTDQWPVLADSLNDGMTIASGATVSFPASYVTGNTWVSGGKGNITLTMPWQAPLFGATISGAIVSMQLSSDHTTVTRGIIAGVLNTSDFAQIFRSWFASTDPRLCSGGTTESVLTQITAASDILHDGTQDPTKTCDGISIGLGFNGAVVQLGSVAPTPTPPPNPCPTDAGSGDAGN